LLKSVVGVLIKKGAEADTLVGMKKIESENKAIAIFEDHPVHHAWDEKF